MLHYNFPPYSVGETGRMGGPGGARSVTASWLGAQPPVIPPQKFPYTIRVVSDITEIERLLLDGSVCGATLALMDAGVPIRADPPASLSASS